MASSEDSQFTVVDSRLAPVAICMICDAEYGAEETQCPKCHVALSLMRRCITCSNIVSAKHTRCIHCGQLFVPEDEKDTKTEDNPALRAASTYQRRLQETRRKRTRIVAVTVMTFLIVSITTWTLMRRLDGEAQIPVIATSYLMTQADLRGAPSSASSSIGKLAPGEALQIVGFKADERSQRWLVVLWNGRMSYLAAEAVAPPKARDAEEGFKLLRFYLAGVDEPALVPEAAKAITFYNAAFPSSSLHGEELRWELAERARHLARGQARDQLLTEARQQYQALIDLNGSYAERARKAINAPPPVESNTATVRAASGKPAISILDGSSNPEQIRGFSSGPAHEIDILDRAVIEVRTQRSAKFTPDGSVPCSVTREIRLHGKVVIPVGAPCAVTVVSTGANAARLTLSNVVVRGRSYAVRSNGMDLAGDSNAPQRSRQLTFSLGAPLAISR